MKILYAIQGTGNGHLSRARAIIPHLQDRGDLDILVSGIQSDIPLPYDVKYKLYGMSFIFGKKGGVDLIGTYKKTQLKKFWKEVNSVPVEAYDMIINDFEPVTSWACQRKQLPCIGLSNQLAVLSPDAPQPKHDDIMGKFVLKHYAPVTSAYGMHFQSYNENIFTPIIRKEIRELDTGNDGHYTVYLPAYKEEKIIKALEPYKEINWQVFSKHSDVERVEDNIHVRPIEHAAFLKSFANCEGILCAAGFATPSEALFLGKKLMVIPMKNQYEQHCNAAALKEMGGTCHEIPKRKASSQIGKVAP